MTNEKQYQEEDTSTFSQNGKVYNLNKLFKLTKNKPTQMFPVSSLKWILAYTTVDIDRVKRADLEAPILVAKCNGSYVVVDGAHRLTKAVSECVTCLPSKYVTQVELESTIIPQEQTE